MVNYLALSFKKIFKLYTPKHKKLVRVDAVNHLLKAPYLLGALWLKKCYKVGCSVSLPDHHLFLIITGTVAHLNLFENLAEPSNRKHSVGHVGHVPPHR